jgi:hypothetical protein
MLKCRCGLAGNESLTAGAGQCIRLTFSITQRDAPTQRGNVDMTGLEVVVGEVTVKAVGERRDLVRPPQRQRGLAHTRRPADRRDHHRARSARPGLIQRPAQRPQFGGPAGEISHRRGQLTRHRCCPAKRAGRGAANGQQLLVAVSRNPCAPASVGRSHGSGWVWPRSQRATMVRSTPNCPASCSWVRPIALRRWARRTVSLPRFLRSLPPYPVSRHPK